MGYTPLAIATILACTITPMLEAGVLLPSSATSALTVPTAPGAQIVKIKNDKGKGLDSNIKCNG